MTGAALTMTYFVASRALHIGTSHALCENRGKMENEAETMDTPDGALTRVVSGQGVFGYELARFTL